jgi:hypothetical protein
MMSHDDRVPSPWWLWIAPGQFYGGPRGSLLIRCSRTRELSGTLLRVRSSAWLCNFFPQLPCERHDVLLDLGWVPAAKTLRGLARYSTEQLAGREHRFPAILCVEMGEYPC